MAGPEADLPDVPGDPARALDRLLKPPAIVHVVESLGGGVLEVVRSLANEAAARGLAATVLFGRRPETPPALDDLFDERVRLVEVSGWGRRSLGSFLGETVRARRALRAELQRHDGGVIHLHSSLAGFVGRVGRVPKGWRMFYTPHAYAFLNDSLPWAVRAGAAIVERGLGRRGTTIAVSDAEGEVAARLVGNSRVTVVHNGIELGSGPEVRTQDGAFTVLCVGRATFQRRADLVADVAAALSGEDGWRFVWVGDGPERQALVDAGVSVEGWVPRQQARVRLEAADAVLHLAAFEGFSIAVLEAMAAARPVVASDVPAIREALGEAGIFVRDADEAQAALRRLRRDETLRRDLGRRARARVEQRFTTEEMAGRALDAYGLAALDAYGLAAPPA